MIKKILLLSLCLCYSKIASSQILITILFGEKLNTDKMEFGLMVSPTLSSLTGMEGTPKPRPGLGLGMYFNIKLSENLFFHPEMNPKSVFGIKGMKPYPTGYATIDDIFIADDKATVQRNIKAISLPLLMRYRIKGLLFAELGPQVDWLILAKDVFRTDLDDNTATYSTNIKDNITHFDFGMCAGLEYKLKKDKGMGLGIMYYYGLTDVVKNLTGTQQNTAWYLKVAIPIGVSPQQ